MEANIKLDEQLLNEAKQLSHIQSTEEVIQRALERYVNTLQVAMDISQAKTTKSTVELALQEYVSVKRRQDLVSLFGNVHWDGDLNQMRTDTTPNEWDQ